MEGSFEGRRRELVARLKSQGLLTEETEKAFLAVRREEFVPESLLDYAYYDGALELAEGSTISQPSMIAIMLKELRVQQGMRVLEVGSGSGYLLALLSDLGCEAVGIEINPRLAAESQRTLDREGCEARVIQGDASTAVVGGDFDRVVFSAAIAEVPSWAVRFLKPGGFVLAPIGGRNEQELVRATAEKTERTGRYCRFVPFILEQA